jgi:hypothetical protein
LADKVRKAVDNGKVQLFATNVQKQELERFSKEARKQARKRVLKQRAVKIRVTFISTSAGVLALDQENVKGFRGFSS